MSGNWSQDMKVVPVNFNTEHKAMLGHCKMILEHDGGRIAINPDRFDKLITALRTAVDHDAHWIKKQHHITIYLTVLG
jgi:hypothetical protein